MKLRKSLEYNDCTLRTHCTIQWVHREAGHRYPSDVSVLAGSLIGVAMISKKPINFYFFELIMRSEKQQGLTLEHQLIALLEPGVHCEIDSNPLRFSQLEKPLESWKEALLHTIDLLNLAPAILLCVSDDPEYMDYGKAKAMCSNILAASKVRKYLAGKNGVIFKTLFTAADASMTIDDRPKADETVFNNELRHQNCEKPRSRHKSFLR
ncbi:uncharacterized protein EAF02_010632 [Botrytis sinoallii]|uniref:uncharacterized protein n=1 Tax=Botrytis sinoallii TaxID=1463999 RepID=UPI001902BBBF|nr:uncharacterized protein EAF02_010632 [Botrytis sinoallii]KAF7861678.1 hypothetical protein EAF02_010632 [Botrytis sinoallii]